MLLDTSFVGVWLIMVVYSVLRWGIRQNIPEVVRFSLTEFGWFGEFGLCSQFFSGELFFAS